METGSWRAALVGGVLLAGCGGKAVIDASEQVVVVEDCSPGEVRACYGGPTATAGHGTCREGKETCVASGTGFSACEGAVLPSAQDCTTADDETCGGPPTCTGDTAWAVTSTAPGTSVGNGVAVFADGSVVVVGSFSGTLDLGGDAITREETSAFVARLDEEGRVVWVLGLQGATSAATAVTVDGSDLTVAGVFQDTVTAGGVTLTSAGAYDSFVMRLSGDGAVQWARAYGGVNNELAADLAPGAGSLGDGFVLAGYLHGATDFGTGTLPFAGTQDLFVLRLDASGEPSWATAAGGPGVENLSGITSDSAGRVTLVGTFEQTLGWGGETTPLVAKGRDGFIAQLAATGGARWASSYAGEGEDHARAVASTDDGDLLVTGLLDGIAVTPSGTLTPHGGFDTFLSRLTPDGDGVDGLQLGGSGATSYGLDVVRDGAGQPILLGAYEGPLDIGGGVLPDRGGQQSIYLTKLDRTLAPVWARGFGDASLQRPSAIADDTQGGVVITGDFSGVLDFGEPYVLADGDASRVFIARFRP